LVSQVLDSFCKASNLKINLHKSRFIVSSNVPRQKILKYTSILGFQYRNKIDKYLGFPILTKRVKKFDFCFIVDRINNKLGGWKAKLLNRLGRVTLAKVVLNVIPIY
ncbi:Putative ribonuclease H protein, partial [Glycine soja]